MAFFKINPTVRNVSFGLADFGVAAGDTVFLRLDGAFQPSTNLTDTARNSTLGFGGLSGVNVDNGLFLLATAANLTVTVTNNDEPLTDNSDPNNDYGIAIVRNTGLLATTAQNDLVGSPAGGAAAVTIDGSGTKGLATAWTATGAVIIGAQSAGSVTVQSKGSLDIGRNLTLGSYNGPAGADPATGVGTLSVTSGGTVVTHAVNGLAFSAIGAGVGAKGTITVSDKGSLLGLEGMVIIGDRGAGLAQVLNGGVVQTSGKVVNNGTTFAAVEQLAINIGSTGSLLLDGEGSIWRSGGGLLIGNKGTAEVTVRNGSSVVSQGAFDTFAGENGGQGSLLITGQGTTGIASSWVAKGGLTIGYRGTGNVTVQAKGSLDVAASLTLGGYFGNGGTDVSTGVGKLSVQSGGTVATHALNGAGFNTVGGGLGAKGTMTVSDKGSLVSFAGAAMIGDRGDGLVTVQSGGLLDVGTNMILGGYNGPTGNNPSTGVGTLAVASGGTVVTHALNGSAFSNIGAGVGAKGTVTVSDNGSLLGFEGMVTIGDRGAGLVQVLNGGQVRTTGLWLNNGTTTTLSDQMAGTAGSSGTLVVDGEGSVWQSGAAFRIAEKGTADVTIRNGGSLVTGPFDFVAGGSGGVGAVRITGKGATGIASSWVTKGALTIGNLGTGNVTVQAAGLLDVATNLILGGYFGNSGTDVSTGVANLSVQSGGTVATHALNGAGFNNIGGGTASKASVVVSDKGSLLAYEGAVTVGDRGAGNVMVLNGGVVQTSGRVINNGTTFTATDQFGFNVGGVASVLIDGEGSAWRTGGGLRIGGKGTADVTVRNGSSVVSQGTFDTFGAENGAQGSLLITGQGTTGIASSWATKGALTIGQQGTASATVQAKGSLDVGTNLTLGGYAGPTGSDPSTGSGTLLVKSGGTVATHGPNNSTIGGGLGAKGTVTVSDTASLLSVGSGFTVGDRGTGVLRLLNGGTVSASGNTQIGANGTGAVTIGAGATFVTGGTFVAVGNNTGSDGLLDIGPGGTFRLTAPIQSTNYTFHIAASGSLATGKGTVKVSGAGALLDTGGNPMAMALNGGNATLIITDGGTVRSGVTDGSLSNSTAGLAVGRGGTAAVSISGKDSNLTVNGQAYFGRAGNATLTVDNGGALVVLSDNKGLGSVLIGVGNSGNTNFIGGRGDATVSSGGLISSANGVSVGGIGSDGSLSVGNGGTVLARSAYTIGNAVLINGSVVGGSGALTIGAGGIVKVTQAPQTASFGMQVGTSGAGVTDRSKGVVTVGGAGALLDLNGNGLEVGRAGIGTLLINGGGTVLVGTPDSNLIPALAVGRLGTGSVVVSDLGSKLVSNGFAFIGRGGDGSLRIENQGSVFVGIDGAGANGSINIGAVNGLGPIWTMGGKGAATITSGGRLTSQLGVGVGIGATGALSVNQGGVVDVGGALQIGQNRTIASGETIMTAAGTSIAQATTVAIGSGAVVLDSGGIVNVQASTATGASVTGVQLGIAVGSTGSLTVTGTGTALNSTKRIGIGLAGTGAMTIANGASVQASTTFAGDGAVFIGGSAGASGNLTVSGPLAALTATGQLTVGVGGTGHLLVSNGAKVQSGGSAVDATEGFVIGSRTGGAGDGTVTGLNALLTNTGRFVVGSAGVGDLTIAAGAKVVTNPGSAVAMGAEIASQADSAGSAVHVLGTGSTWQIGAGLLVGNQAAGSLAIATGGTVTASSLEAGRQAGAVGKVSVDGAASRLLVSGTSTIGSAGSASVLISNGAQFVTTGVLVVGDAGAGSLSAAAGGTILAGQTIVLGRSAGGSGTIDVDATSQILLGSTANAARGIVVNAGALITGQGRLNAAVLNLGTVAAVGGTLGLAGAIAGGGVFRAEAASVLDFLSAGAMSADSPLVLNGGVVRFHEGAPPANFGLAARIDATAAGGTIDLDNTVLSVGGAQYDAVNNQTSQTGTISVGGGTALVSLHFAGTDFATVANGNLIVTNGTAPVPVVTPTIALDAASDSGRSASDRMTNVTLPRFLGTAGANAQVTVLAEGVTVIGTATADAAGAWAMTPSKALSAGLGSFTARVAGTGGAADATSTSLSVLIDVSAPAAPIVPDLAAPSDTGRSNVDNITAIAAPLFAGQAEAVGKVDLYDGATLIGTAIASSVGAWTMQSKTLAEGVHSLTAKVTDLAGNVSAASPVMTATIDTTAPVAPTALDMTAATDTGRSAIDNVTATTAPVFTGRAEGGSLVELFDGVTLIGSSIVGALGNWAVQAKTLPEGVHTITAKATDAAGNVSVASAVLLVTIDATAPAAPAAPDLAATSDTGRLANDNISSATTPVFTGQAEAGAQVDLFDGATLVGSAIAGSLGNWTVQSKALAEGVHAFTVKVTDISGNASATSAAVSVTIDTTAPAAAAPDLAAASDTGPSNSDNITSNTAPLFTGRAEGGAQVDLFDGATRLGSGIVGTLGNWAVQAKALTEGVHTLTAKFTDVAGNVSAVTPSLVVTIDTATPAASTAPDLVTASDSGLSPVDNITSVSTPQFSGKAEGGTQVTLMDSGTILGTGIVGALGNWTVQSKALAAGVHVITAVVNDLAGNVAPAVAAVSVTIDTAAPAAPSQPDLAAASDTGRSNADDITSSTAPLFIGKAEAGSQVTLFDGAVVIGTSGVGALGNWAVQSKGLAAGLHTITARATDAAGNTSVASSAVSVTIDTTAPDAPTTPDLAAASDNGASTTDNKTSIVTPLFTGRGEGGAQVTLFDGATVIGTGGVGALGNWAVQSKALSVGTHQVSAKITDAAGNTSVSSAALAVTITATPPLSAVAVSPLASAGGGEASSAIALPGGGAVLLDPDIADTTVMLGSATHLILNKMRFITAVGSDGDDTLSAQGPDQTLTGGLGHDVLEGFGGFATTFCDTAAGLDGDIIRNFGGNDVIELTDLLPGATLSYQGNASGGTLSVSDGTHAARISLEGSYTVSDFRLAGDGNGGSQIALIRP